MSQTFETVAANWMAEKHAGPPRAAKRKVIEKMGRVLINF